MSLDHSRIEELLAVQALGGLDGDDIDLLARERAAHGDCDECRRLEDGFAEIAAGLAVALEPEPVDASMVERILAAPLEQAPGGEATPSVDDLSERRERRAGRSWQAAIAVAAALAVIVVAASVLRPSPVAISDASPVQQIVRFDTTIDGDLAMAYTPGRPGAVLWGSGLADPALDQVFEIWMIQDGEPISGGCVSPQDGTIGVALEADVSTSDLMAVTIEDAACPGAPTTDPVAVAELV